MNSRLHLLPVIAALAAVFSLVSVANAAPEMPKSVFVIPEDSSQGHDPFFPNSMRPYLSNKGPAKPTSAPTLSDLVVKSILPSGDRIYAIINNHTFTIGDEGPVLVKGQRMSVKCISINAATGTVTVESEGVRAVLTFKP
ncbi:MAG TPA: hypothetical protein VN625_11025 [Desulfuromonadaceae bacterium]|nr:hypothetical protein [Desulfuromonadaceae bacterium]